MIPRVCSRRLALLPVVISNQCCAACSPLSMHRLLPLLHREIRLQRRRQFASKTTLPATSTPSVRLRVSSPIKTPEELKTWERNCDVVNKSRPKSEQQFKDETQELTTLVEKQVNHWHRIDPLSKDQIGAVQKVTKLALLNRNMSSLAFVNILEKEKCFDPDTLYLAAQTMFRSIPAIATHFQKVKPPRPEIFHLAHVIRRRLFYLGLLAGHIPSALCLWWSISYDTPTGQSEKDMILRCLADDANILLYGSKVLRLAQALKADAKGDVKAARDWFDKLEGEDLGEFDLLWKKRVEYMFAVDEREAMVTALMGIKSFSMPVIVHTLEQLLDYSEDDNLKVQIHLYLQSMSSKYTLTRVAQIYEQNGDIMMAREYHEIAGRTGNKDSQRWIVEYLEKRKAESWFKKTQINRELFAWRKLANVTPPEIPRVDDSRRIVE